MQELDGGEWLAEQVTEDKYYLGAFQIVAAEGGW